MRPGVAEDPHRGAPLLHNPDGLALLIPTAGQFERAVKPVKGSQGETRRGSKRLFRHSGGFSRGCPPSRYGSYDLQPAQQSNDLVLERPHFPECSPHRDAG